jgi:mannose-6-phosphate isomerase-like protein (cupin superfamily)
MTGVDTEARADVSPERNLEENDLTAADSIVVLGPGEGKEVLDVFGGLIAIEADGDDTRSAYTLLQMTLPAGFTPPPPHIHHEEEEAWFVLEGSLTFQIGERTVEAPAGSFVLVPRGTTHTFCNPGPGPAKWLTIFSPSGMEGYFREFAHRGHLYQTASMEEIQALARRFKFEFV